MKRSALLVSLAAALSIACLQPPREADPVTRAADEYVRLVAALGQHDPDSVESEGALGEQPEGIATPLAAIADSAEAAAARLAGLPPTAEASDTFRREHLIEQLAAVALRAREIGGVTLTSEQERRLLGKWAALPASGETGREREVRDTLSRLVPGTAPLSERVDTFDSQFLVPRDRLPDVFERGLRECRERTLAYIRLPPGEGVTIRYVTGRPWSGYSRYKGEGRSQIEVNTSYPLTVDRALELACHEGYPGHHAQNVIRDESLVRARHWHEFTVMPVFSPESFAAEAVASLAPRLVFSDEERLAFERDVLFPLAGLDRADASRYLRVARLREQLEPAIAGVVADYLAGKLDVIEAGWALEEQAIMQQPLATLQFVNRYRGYSLAYTRGKLHAARTLEAGAPKDRWRIWRQLLEPGTAVTPGKEKREAG